ncbi:MAG: TRAP transporter small permease [Marinosulfonomonas sp.]|nr:TRAP transporter small permease [Marinosulfonomonas sp.]
MTTETSNAPPIFGGAFHTWAMRLALFLAVLGGAGTVGIMIIINADVVGRGLFSTPVPATAEIVSASIVAIIYLQLPYATATNRNIRSDMLLGRLHAKSQRYSDALNLVHHAVGTIMLAILLRYIWPEIINAYEDLETIGLYGVFTMPRWPFVAVAVLGCTVTFGHFLLLTLGYANRLFNPGANS